jgi:protein involved in polysaccharide export with SLBB domain
MKNIYLLFLATCLFLNSFLNSQELDETFLRTLPQGMQNDILNRIDEQGQIVDPIYRSIETQTKLEKKELEDLKNRLEQDLEFLKDKLSENEDNLEKRDELPLFGSDFFRTYQTTYMPINEPNLSSEYILDYGDALEIQLIGQTNSIDVIRINRDGSINLPIIGKLNLAGISLGEAYSIIKAKVSSSYIGTEAYVSLSNIRDINVLVSGNAFNPGIYTLSGNSNMLHALAVAGGINEYGSYREINLIRDKKIIETLDMYDVLITGEYNSNIRLRPGDIVFVSPLKNLVSIDGAVKKPAKYEVKDNQYLSEVIKYADGITVQADLSNIFLDRVLDGKVKALPISNIKQFDSILSNDGDKVFIRKHSFRAVNIQGAILKPGRYLMAEGETLSELIKKSGGYTKNAYPFGAVYENQNALLINKMAKDRLYGEFIDNIITVSQKNPTGGFDLSSVVELTENLRNSSPNGRVVIDLENETSSDYVVKDGDKLIIPEKPNHVYIYGEVSYEGALKYYPDEEIQYYINKSGGLKSNADQKLIYVLHPNGDTQRSTLKKSLFQNSPESKLKLYPGSIIFVPRTIDNSATNRLAAQAYVSILGNIGIALASLSSINNN